MPKKILVIKGSPRLKGNSSTLADQAAEAARAKGAQIESFDLQKMHIEPCNACDYCQKVEEYHCNVEDDMQILFPKVLDADALVIASPIYWFTMSAQTKLFMDRLYSLQSSNGLKLKDKKVGIILVYGDSDAFSSGGMNAVHSFRDAFRFLHCSIVDIVHGTASDVGDIQKNIELMARARKLGEILAG
jgi:multimeric flavodoxin WrbA